MTDQLLDAYSRINANDVPFIDTCTVVVGDGTMKVEFKNGRAKVPAGLAHLLAKHGNIDIPALATVPEPAPLPAPVTLVPDVPAVTDPAVGEPNLSAEVKAAIEHLKADGEHIPDIEFADVEKKPADPNVFLEAMTADGLARCQALKTDGSQCSNAAVGPEGRCNLPKHRPA